ncbi:hypothetical protein [Microbacterium sp. LWO13-1.2]|uniref:hypothetical protein n=1 Tax=Microbacterium sp. LWO13-1.2 TaxID=3135262 RepID=UPI003138889B
MADLDTRPVPVALPRKALHEHAWVTESRHPTSDGVLLYVKCAGCGTRRVDVQARLQHPPTALSREIDAT